MNDKEKLKMLNRMYEPELRCWLMKFPKTHKMYEFFSKLNSILIGTLKPDNERYKLSSVELMLQKFFGRKISETFTVDDDESSVTISIDDSDCDESQSGTERLRIRHEEIVDLCESLSSSELSQSSEEKLSIKPQIDQEIIPLCEPEEIPRKVLSAKKSQVKSAKINEYALKTPKLPPSSSYAAKINNPKKERKIISLETKKVKVFKSTQNYDPVEEAIKLKNIKEKIYCKNFLHMDQDAHQNFNSQNSSAFISGKSKISKRRKTIDQLDLDLDYLPTTHKNEPDVPKKYKLRKRYLSVYTEKDSNDSSDSEYNSIPIDKSARSIRKGKRKSKS